MPPSTSRQAALQALSQHLNTLSLAIRLNQEGDDIKHNDCFATDGDCPQEDDHLQEAFLEMSRLDKELEDLEKRVTSLSVARVQQRALLNSRVRESEVRNEQRRRLVHARDRQVPDDGGESDDDRSLSSSIYSGQNNNFKRTSTLKSVTSGASVSSARQSVSASFAGSFSVSRQREERSGEQIFTSRPLLRKDFSRIVIGSSLSSTAPAGPGTSAVRKLIEARKPSSSSGLTSGGVTLGGVGREKEEDLSMKVKLNATAWRDAAKNAAATVKRWSEDVDVEARDFTSRTLTVEEESRLSSLYKDDFKSVGSFRFKDF